MKWINRLILLLITFNLSILITSAECLKFNDIKIGSWQEKYTNIAIEKGISKGYTGCMFKPSSDITYIEALSIIFRTLGINKIGNSTWENNTIKTYIALLSSSNEGLEIKRKINNNYNDKIKRQEVLFLFIKFIELQNSGKITNLRIKDFSSDKLYTDVDSTSDYYNYIYIFNKAGIISNENNFLPNNNITRIEFLKILINTFYNNDKKNILNKNIDNIINTQKTKITLNDLLVGEGIFGKGDYEMNKNDYNTFEKKYIILTLKDYFSKDIINFIDNNYSKIEDFLIAYDYLNNTKKYDEFIFNKNNFVDILTNIKGKGFLLGYKEAVDNFYLNYIGKGDKNYLPNIFNDKGFQFMLKGFTDEKKEIIRDIAKDIGLEDSDLVLAGILTEQTRYAFTNRGYVKEFMKGVPVLFSMTQFSYGVGGIKEQTGKEIEKDSINYGYGEKVLNYDKNTTIKQRLTDEYYEFVYPTLLVKNILTRWNNEGYDISNKIGVIGTLYNFGNSSSKKPHGNPQIGGAIITIEGNNYTFGGLYNSLYWYLKINK